MAWGCRWRLRGKCPSKGGKCMLNEKLPPHPHTLVHQLLLSNPFLTHQDTRDLSCSKRDLSCSKSLGWIGRPLSRSHFWGNCSPAENIQVMGTHNLAAIIAMWACFASPAPKALPTLQMDLMWTKVWCNTFHPMMSMCNLIQRVKCMLRRDSLHASQKLALNTCLVQPLARTRTWVRTHRASHIQCHFSICYQWWAM